MVTINPAILNSHALNVVMKVSPTNFDKQDRIAFFTWLDNMIRAGITEAKREDALFETLDQTMGSNIRNTVVHRNNNIVPAHYWGRITRGQISIFGTIERTMLETRKLPRNSVEGRSEQLIDLFNSMIALLTSDHPRDDVAQMVREYLESDVENALPQITRVRPAKIKP